MSQNSQLHYQLVELQLRVSALRRVEIQPEDRHELDRAIQNMREANEHLSELRRLERERAADEAFKSKTENR